MNPTFMSGTGKGGIRRVLLVCNMLVLPYKVLQCLAPLDVQVFVLGNQMSRALRLSRLCHRFIESKQPFDGRTDEAVLHEINHHATELGVDVIIPGDQCATRTLAGTRSRLVAPCFPVPDLPTYDRLYNKLDFAKLCATCEIPTPPTLCLPDRDAVIAALRSAELPLPVICKPLAAEGGNGVIKVTSANAEQQLRQINYAPILMQKFIEGEDIGASVFCNQGKIQACVIHQLKRQTYHTFHHKGIRAAICRLMTQVMDDGVYNFDMRRAPDGEVVFLECNPRFFLKMPLSMWAGINFVVEGFGGAERPAMIPDGRSVRLPKALGADLLCRPWALTRRDWVAFKALISDPVPFVRDATRRWRDNEAAVNYHRQSY